MAEHAVTARRLVEDLEQAAVDPAVVRHVRIGLRAIAGLVADLPRRRDGQYVDRQAVLDLVDPEAPA